MIQNTGKIEAEIPGGSRLSSLPFPGVISDGFRTRYRSLPHWQSGGTTYFITFRLHGIPGHVIPLSMQERMIVRDAILFWHRTKWHVHLLTVMPDHVHILATPCESAPNMWHSLSRILQSIKGFTAHSINVSRNMKGRLWQSESFDRIVRDAAEYDEKAIYILNNAAKAEIVADGWEYEGFRYEHEV